MHSRIQLKLFFMLVLVVMFLSIAILWISRSQQHQIFLAFEDQKNQMDEIIDGIIDLKGRSLYALAFDYTYWDEMVAFVQDAQHPQQAQWAYDNIHGSLSTFGVQYAWVLDLSQNVIYQSRQDGYPDMPLPVSAKDFFKLFQNRPLEHFFAWSGDELLEMRAATVHPTSDIERQTPRQGYFFVGRLWDQDLLSEFSGLLHAQLSLQRPISPSLQRSTAERLRQQNKMYFAKDLKGVDGQPVASLSIERPFLLGDYMEQFSLGYRKLFLFAALIFIVVFFLFGFFWISRPLLRIAQAVSKEDSAMLQQMSENSSEFGSLSQLIIRFFKQKEKLLKEIIERRRTQRKLREAQSQLLQSEKMAAVGQLSSGIAHEIKNPLANILLAVDCLKQEIPSSNIAVTRQVEIIRKAAVRTNNIIMELLNFAREKRIQMEPRALNETVEEAIRLADHYLRVKDISIQRQYYRDKKIVVSIDPLLIEQALINIISNAVDAIEGKGVITFSTSVKEDVQRKRTCAVLEIKDTGKGMTPEVQQKIFNPFFTTKEIGFGTGLGLSNSYMIFKRHESQVEVKSAPGQGTTFVITFPCLLEHI
ncbi:MAG TPA: ATP-binding protein [Candidatus Omnitrophota bacterium]|nr:ATP-binding protein [Candidatus Omnitrophota bacterium]